MAVGGVLRRGEGRPQDHGPERRYLRLRRGENKVELRITSGGGGRRGGWFWGLELVDINDWGEIQRKIRDTRADMSYWSEKTYGIFLQWGGWGGAKDGSAKPWQKMIDGTGRP